MDVAEIMAGSGGIVFKQGGGDGSGQDKKLKTKAKKSSYAKGTHGSGAAKMKAAYKKKRQARNSK